MAIMYLIAKVVLFPCIYYISIDLFTAIPFISAKPPNRLKPPSIKKMGAFVCNEILEKNPPQYSMVIRRRAI